MAKTTNTGSAALQRSFTVSLIMQDVVCHVTGTTSHVAKKDVTGKLNQSYFLGVCAAPECTLPVFTRVADES